MFILFIALSYVSLFPIYTTYTTIITTINIHSLFFSQKYSAYKLFKSNNTCALDLYSRDLQTTTVHFTSNVSSHKTDWITTDSLCAMSCHFIYASDQSDEGSWSDMFVSPPSRDFYGGFVVVCEFFSCYFLQSLKMRYCNVVFL